MNEAPSTEITVESSFSFSVALRLSNEQWKRMSSAAFFSSLSGVVMHSRVFSSYEECITSARQLMNDVLAVLNTNDDTFKLGVEINPLYTNQPTLSRDWGPSEVSRIWLYEKNMEGKGHISAAGQARIRSDVNLLEPVPN